MTSPAVTFLTGYSSRRGALGLLTFPDMMDARAPFCRLFSYAGGQWGSLDLKFQCKSITVKSDPARNYRAWWVLGKNGQVAEIAGGAPNIDQIPGAGLEVSKPYGYVEAIKNIGGELYVCGYGRQVYKQTATGWTSIADDILTRDTGTGFFDIDGTDQQHVYAVGWKGEIYLHDGKTWHRDDGHTTAHLGAVRCLGPDNVWICGNDGVVLHGRFNHWERLSDPAFVDNWYSIEEFNGQIYLAGNNVLARIVNGSIQRVDPGLGKPFTVHRLHAKDGMLWAIGSANILTFDGKTWSEVIHPDNV
ncbi:WD40/YVTN/BNR-like repeat-containing protein [Chryseolinea soli]|uniref:Uncharacterized protein n=1 Tax=Chryseolinea soli TaxID=2321403 RepID=A0A385SGT0_9BACT|nr:hypothetical protein [Chryseolinea soli]AYB30144.1 hypothetical protein D4L85_05910 [Chryseolinea soli]